MIKISIIEDDTEIRESLAILIEGTDGFSCVSHYGSVELALEKLEKDAPDVILMDIKLPGMSGIEGVKLVKEKIPNCEIIMQTISENDKDVFDVHHFLLLILTTTETRIIIIRTKIKSIMNCTLNARFTSLNDSNP